MCPSVSASASQEEVKAETVGYKQSDAQALVDTFADSEAEMKAETLRHTLSDAQALDDMMADSLA